MTNVIVNPPTHTGRGSPVVRRDGLAPGSGKAIRLRISKSDSTVNPSQRGIALEGPRTFFCVACRSVSVRGPAQFALSYRSSTGISTRSVDEIRESIRARRDERKFSSPRTSCCNWRTRTQRILARRRRQSTASTVAERVTSGGTTAVRQNRQRTRISPAFASASAQETAPICHLPWIRNGTRKAEATGLGFEGGRLRLVVTLG